MFSVAFLAFWVGICVGIWLAFGVYLLARHNVRKRMGRKGLWE